MESTRKLENVCLIRWLAALFVMTGHMYSIMLSNPPLLLWKPIQKIGIYCFFVLGGYLVTGSFARDQKLRNFYIKRGIRIFPPLILFVLVVAVIIGPMISTLSAEDYFTHPAFRKYLLNMGLYINYVLPGVFENNPYPNAVNGSLWSLPVEVFMYFLVPIYYKLSKKSYKIGVSITLFACVIAFIKNVYFPEFRYVIYAVDLGPLIEHVPFYFIGMMVYILEENKKLSSKINPAYAIVVVFVSLMFVFGTEAYITILTFICVPFFVFGVASIDKFWITKLLSKFEVTYGIFLYGFFIQQLIIYFNYKYNWQEPFIILHLSAVIITIGFAIFSYFFVEKPLINWSRKLLKKSN